MTFRNLFISSFRKHGKGIIRWGRCLASLAAFLLLLDLTAAGLNYLYVDDTESWERFVFHHYYENEENIDCLYLGSSHVYCSLNPVQMDQLNGQNNYNVATSSQPLLGSYYLLKEANQKNKISHVYLELFYELSGEGLQGDYERDDIRGRFYYLANCMKPGIEKGEYMAAAMEYVQGIELFFPFVQYRSNIINTDYVAELLGKKASVSYGNYYYQKTDARGSAQFKEKSFYERTYILGEEELYFRNKQLQGNFLSADAEKYLRRILTYCERERIPLTLFSSPVPNLCVSSSGNYEGYVKRVTEIAEEYGVPYYDFNLCKDEYFPIQSLENFSDDTHLNATGAALFTDFFHTVVSGTPQENQRYFYTSYAEKLAQTEPELYGLYYKADEETQTKQVHVASNRSGKMEYRIIATPKEGKQRTIQDFSINEKFSVPMEEHGWLTVVGRMQEEPSQVQTLEVKY